MPGSLAADAQAIYTAAVHAVQADRLLAPRIVDALLGSLLLQEAKIVGAGKAAMAMAGALEAAAGAAIAGGLVVVPHGYRSTLPASQAAPRRVEVVEAGHPVPDAEGVRAARRVGALADGLGVGDRLVVLISGGGSALWPAPAHGLALEDVQATSRLLLASGADIHRINVVRKHLSALGGGQLAARAAPAEVVALVVSDVVGDDLASIASGPTVPDPSTFGEAVEILRECGLWEAVPDAIRAHLEAGARGDIPETPKPGEAVFEHVRTHLLGSNRRALEAAREAAEALGYRARLVAADLTGEARDVGRKLARQLLDARAEGPCCLLWGGETTVTVTGRGQGGRNQELALAAALALDGGAPGLVLLSAGTDGRDGPTDAAGALATPSTYAEARALGLDPAAQLANNDAYPLFDRLGALLRPGPTHTNVMDVQIGLVGA